MLAGSLASSCPTRRRPRPSLEGTVEMPFVRSHAGRPPRPLTESPEPQRGSPRPHRSAGRNQVSVAIVSEVPAGIVRPAIVQFPKALRRAQAGDPGVAPEGRTGPSGAVGCAGSGLPVGILARESGRPRGEQIGASVAPASPGKPADPRVGSCASAWSNLCNRPCPQPVALRARAEVAPR